jgi:hypothetical protein
MSSLNLKGISARGRVELQYEIGLLEQMNERVRVLQVLTKPVVNDGCPKVHRAIVQRYIDQLHPDF